MHFRDASNYPFGILGHIYLVKFLMTVSAVVTGLVCGFSKVFQNVIAKAGGGHTVAFHKLKASCVLVTDLLCFSEIHALEILAAKEHFTDHNVLRGEEKNTFCRFSVTTCTAGFLVVVFHTLWHVVMDDETHVGLVDSHSKRVGGNHNLGAVIDEIILAFLADLCVHSRMITGDRNTLF